uniref:Transmembrane protein n=1 Tax=Setaria digitata TaxID=48799 RepID=A0A915Q841_9BILA
MNHDDKESAHAAGTQYMRCVGMCVSKTYVFVNVFVHVCAKSVYVSLYTLTYVSALKRPYMRIGIDVFVYIHIQAYVCINAWNVRRRV